MTKLPLRRRAGRMIVLVTLLVAVPAHATAATKPKPKPKLPTLLAQATATSGKRVAKRVTLELLDPTLFKVTKRPNAATVTLGWPAARPCAFSTYTLRILPDAGDAAAATQLVVPDADATGTATRWGKQQIDGTRPTFVGAWREDATILNSNKLTVHAVAATPLLDTYGEPAGGLVQLELVSRTLPGTRCSGLNRFRVGPAVVETIITAA